jgi:hypothetical protein
MKRAPGSLPTKGRKRARATDVVDPSRPWASAVDQNAPSSSALISRQAVPSALSVTGVTQLVVPDVREQRPRWDHMRQQLLRLPTHLPHCLPYIVDETISMTPGESQSAIQARGTCTNAYNCLREPLLTVFWRV